MLFNSPWVQPKLQGKIKMKKIASFLSSCLFLLSGCSGPEVTDYDKDKPQITIRNFFEGPIDGWGIFQDYSGKVIKHFTMKMHGEWNGNKGKLFEKFYWMDGSMTERIWDLEALSPSLVRVITPEVVGEGIGKSSGNAIQWNYTLKVPVNDSIYEFFFDDWMYAVTENVIINKAKMKKFGFVVGEVTLCLKRQTP